MLESLPLNNRILSSNMRLMDEIAKNQVRDQPTILETRGEIV